ncbi:MAG: class I tRNA ligase family protein, partial [Actinobacteria bacterium]|nr:class I tRNA ligase family protein [Actinomycetota bacterium]
SFFVTYANADGFDPTGQDIPPAERPLLDRWILSQLAQTVREARDGLEGYDATAAGRRVAGFVDDLSNWYVRRARRRFWDPGGTGGVDSRAAFLTLHECLVTVAQLLAPFTPFVAEEIWRNLAAGRQGAPESVHLSDYPVADPSLVDPQLDAAMRAAREIVSLGRTVRTETKVKVRQPLLEAVVHYPGDRAALRPLLPLIVEELNVKEVLFAESAEQLAGWRAKPNFKVLGPRLGERVKAVAEALARDDGSIASALARGDRVVLADVTPGPEIDLGPEDVDLSQETRAGWGVAAEGGITVALELALTPELRLEGLARELVRLVQDARKAAGLEVGDRIQLGIEATGEPAEALAAHREYVAGETLATMVADTGVPDPLYRQEASVDGAPVTVTLRRA